jgi:hypothetical protein
VSEAVQSPQQEQAPPPFPKTTVLIVSRNCVEPLRRCLTALKAAHYREWIETFVVDLGSRDGSGQMDAEFPGVTALRLPRHFGKSRARNIGARSATGELLLLLDPAVEPPPDFVPIMAKTFAEEADAGAVLLERYPLPDRETLKQWCRGGAPTPVAVLIRKSFLAGMNYFDEKRYAHFGGELELFRQIAIAGKKQVVLGDLLEGPVPKALQTDTTQADQDLLMAETIQGASAYLIKHEGVTAGVKFRLGFTLSSLGRFAVFSHLIGGQRLDGTQGGAFL